MSDCFLLGAGTTHLQRSQSWSEASPTLGPTTMETLIPADISRKSNVEGRVLV